MNISKIAHVRVGASILDSVECITEMQGDGCVFIEVEYYFMNQSEDILEIHNVLVEARENGVDYLYLF